MEVIIPKLLENLKISHKANCSNVLNIVSQKFASDIFL